MLTFTEEEFEKYQNRIAGERREAQLRRSYQGAVSRAQGAQFEQAIADAEGSYCKYKTAVPGGMGLMVRAALLLNVLDAYKWRRGLM